MFQTAFSWVKAVGGTLLLGGLASAQTPAPTFSDADLRFFENHIRPLLAEHCWKCHRDRQVKGGLRLDSRQAILDGGDSGQAIVVGKPGESLLMEAVRHESLEMPPDQRLPDESIDLLAKWIELGAPWPVAAEGPTPRGDADRFTDEERGWWAIQPLSQPEPPPVSEVAVTNSAFAIDVWKKNPIDAFILDKMSSQGLFPAGEADAPALIRRLYFDLTGLPPTPEQVSAFVNDRSADAYEKVVEELLASPRYGEHWARYWLDLVRYADSDGYKADAYRPHAWRYRDYVIDSFNHDKPYDRFVLEQIAGDELFPDDPQAIVGTGFLRHWIYEYNNRDVRTQWSSILNDVTDTTSDVFLGLGLQCAKCHDHKFDPLLQKDYYRLRAFFEPIMSMDRTLASSSLEESYLRRSREWEAATAALREEIEAIEGRVRQRAADDATSKFPPDIQAILRKPASDRSPYERQLHEIAYRQITFEYERLDTKVKGPEKEKLIALKKELSAFDHLKPPALGVAMSVQDVGWEAPPTMIPKRSKEPVLPGYPTLIDPRDAEVTPPAVAGVESTGRRTALARWITQTDNPLTARVLVNRIWQYHFGRGLAANASDFGRLGGSPTHPELLDWLASQFIKDGWSLKQLHRQIVRSATYRQSTSHPRFQDFQRIDPANVYRWRGDTRRLSAEQIRDSVLAVSGQLRHAEVVTVPVDEQRDGFRDRIEGGEGVLPDVPRRSIYTRNMRNARDPLLEAFDLPLFFSSESARHTTTTPVQSLLLFNSPELIRHATLFAESVSGKAADAESQIDLVFRTAYGREPRDEERNAALQFLRTQADKLGSDEAAVESLANESREIGRLPYRDGQAIFVSQERSAMPMPIPDAPCFDLSAWTVESFFQIRSVYETSAVRTAVSKWSGKSGDAGWSFGVTGKGSRRKPQTLVMVLWGKDRTGKVREAAVFSDQLVELNKPYFAAATVKPAGDQPGKVTFYLKDLSNDDEPLWIEEVEHELVGPFDNQEPVMIGGCGVPTRTIFDGLIDDIRISRGVVPAKELLLHSETVTEATVAYWRFEPDPGVLSDSSPNAMHIGPSKLVSLKHSSQRDGESAAAGSAKSPEFLALVDFCHAILNSNEFLYVE